MQWDRPTKHTWREKKIVVERFESQAEKYSGCHTDDTNVPVNGGDYLSDGMTRTLSQVDFFERSRSLQLPEVNT